MKPDTSLKDASARAGSVLPGLRVLLSYEAAWLPKDLVAGLVLATLLVPQGMAYAELAGLPAITGLYTSILCLTGYAIFGPSRILVLGPDSSLGPMIAATILPLLGANGDPQRAVELASMLALLVGAITVLGGVLRLGFVADLLSKPTMIGYMNGLAVTILVGQLPKLFGFSIDADGFVDEVKGFVSGVADGRTVTAALAVGLVSLATIVILQRVLPRVPGVLVAVVLSIVATSVFQLEQHGVKLVGTLPQGFPPLTVPDVPLSDLTLLLGGALGIALVTLADTIATASVFAERTGQELERQPGDDRDRRCEHRRWPLPGLPRQHERFADGSRRAGRCEDAGHGPGGSADDRADARARAGTASEPAPAHPRGRRDRSVSVARRSSPGRSASGGSAGPSSPCRSPPCSVSSSLGVLPGIAIAVALSIANVFRRAWWPYQAVLGRVDGLPGYHDRVSYPDAELLPGLVIFRFDAPLLFANARTFRDQIRTLAAADPQPTWIIVAAEPITDVDTTASDMLEDLDVALNEKGVSLVFAELKDSVRAKIERYELTQNDRSGALLPDARCRNRRVSEQDRRHLGARRHECSDA